jgi:type I restriction enzyme S subunit
VTELPRAWAWATLGEVCEKLQYGWTTKAEPTGEGLKLLRTTDITRGAIDWSKVPRCTIEPPDPSKYLLHAGDIVVSRAGSVGASARIRDVADAVFASYLIRLRTKEVDSSYLGWFLKSPQYWRQIEAASAGIALQNVNATKLASLRLPVAPLAEQRRIVAAIEEQLSRLEAARSLLSTALARARSLRVAVLDRLFSETWPSETLGALATLADGPFGSNLKTSHYVSEGPRVVRLQNVGDGFFRDERAHITQEHFDQLSKHAVEPGDIVAASLGEEAPRACLVPAWLGPAVVKADCVRIRPGERVLNAYVMWALNSQPVKQQAASRIKGIGRPRLGVGGLRALRIPVPPIAAQKRACAEIEVIMSSTRTLEKRVDAALSLAEALRRSTLSGAFRGELTPQDPDDEPASVLLARIGRPDRSADFSTAERERTPP